MASVFPLGCTSSHQRNLCSPCPGTQLLGPRDSNCLDVLGDSRGLPCVRISASTWGALGPSGGGDRRATCLSKASRAPAADMRPQLLLLDPAFGSLQPAHLGLSVSYRLCPREALACCHPLWPRFPLHRGRQASSRHPAHLPLSDPLPEGCSDPPQRWCPHWSFLRPPRAPETSLPILGTSLTSP